MSTLVGQAHLELTASTSAAKATLTAFAAAMRKELQALAQPVKIGVRVDQARVDAEVGQARAKLQTLGTNLKNLFKIDVSALTTLSAKIGQQITDLRDLENRLRTSGSGAGGSGSGTGGGGPPPVSNAYAAQLRALQGDLRAGATSTAQFEAATRALKTSIDAEIASLRSAGVLTREQQQKLDSLRATSGQAGQALTRLGQDASRAAEQAARASARAAAEAARATQQATRTAARAQSEGVARLGRDLQNARSQYERGATSLRTYLREMERIKVAGTSMASGLAAGSREAAQLERVMGGLSRGTARINDQSITKLRSDLAAARTQFERATAAAGTFADKRAALRAYQDAMRGLEQRIQAVGQRSTVTAGQLRSLNQLGATLASQRNATNGLFTPVGLAGNIVNALKSLPQFAAVAGGSLGAAAAQASSLGGAFTGIAGLGGPVGIAIGVVTAAVVALTGAITASVRTAAEFEQTLADIRALTQPTAAQLQQLTQATFQIGQPLGVGARQAAAAVLELNKAGLSAKDVIGGGLKGALELAGAAGLSTAEASTIATSALTAFGLQAQQLPRVADVFANFSNKTFLGAQDLSQAIAAVGPVARSSGLDLQQFSGIMATLAQGGFKAMSDAGTSLKTMLLSLQAPSETGAGALKALKVSAYDAAGGLRPFNQTLEELRGKLIKLTPEAQKKLMKDIFGTDAIRAAEILLREGPRAIDANTEAMRKQGEAARVASERLQSLQGAGKQFGAAFEELRIRVGTPFLGFLAGVVRASTEVVVGLTGLIASAQQGQGVLGGFVTTGNQALTALGGVAGTVFTGIKALWDNVLWPVLRVLFTVWATIQQAATTALTLLFNIVSGIFQGVAAAVQTLLGNFGVGEKGIRLSLSGIADAVVRGGGIARAALAALGKFAATLPETFKLAGTGVGTVLTGVGKLFLAFGQTGKAVFLAAGRYAGAFAVAVGQTAQSIGQIVRGLAGVFGALLLAVRNAFVEKTRGVLVGAARLYGAFVDGTQQVLGKLAGAFFRYVVQPVHAGADFLVSAYNRVTGIVAGAANAIGKVLSPIGNVLKALGLSIGDALAGAAKAAADVVGGVVDSFAGAANAAYARAQAAAQAQAAESARSTASGVEQVLNGAAGSIEGFVRDNGAGGALDAALGNVKSGVAGVGQVVGNLQGNLAGVTQSLGADLKGATQTAAAGLGDVRTGAQLTGAALDQVKAAGQDAAASFNADLRTLGSTAKTTAAAVAAIKPPTQLASGTMTLADLGLGGGKGKGGKTTAADLAAQAAYKKGLKDLTRQELAAAKAEALRTNNKKAMSAILAEETRRQNAATSASRQGTAAAQRDAQTRATLVREIRQSIAAFKLQSDQGKVTAASQIAFNQRMEDFRARVAKLPPALQQGTQALFQQAAALSSSAKLHGAAGRAVQTSGIALTKFKAALRGKSDEQLRDLKVQAEARKDSAAYNAVVAEQERRTRSNTAATRQGTAAAQRDATARANLVREIRQSIAAFALQAQQGKVTAQSQLAFNQRMEDFRARVAKLPPALQKGTEALFQQAAALSKSADGQARATRATTLSGAALIKYKEALRGKSEQQLKDLEVEARAKNLGPQLAAILAEKTRRTSQQAAADRKAAGAAQQHQQAAGNLERETRQLNERFALQVQQGKVTAESLQTYRQALEDARAKVAQLPEALRGTVTALLTQGQTLAQQGQGIVDHRQEVEKLKGAVDAWTLAELENARARVLANGGDKDKLAVLDAEISRRKTLSDAAAAQAHSESLLAQASAGQETAEGRYENRQAAAGGNLAELYRIELQEGAKVQAARDAAARAAAADEERQIRDRYQKLLDLEGLTDERRRELEADRDREIAANGERLTNVLAKNAQDRATAELNAKEALDQALLSVDRETRDRLRKNALADLQARTGDVEAQQQAELDAEDLTEQQRLEIRKKYQPLLLAAKQAEVDQSRRIEEEAETDRYNDAVEAARKQGILGELRLQADGSYITVAEALERAHQNEMLVTRQKYAREYRDYELGVKRETGKQVVAAQKATSASLKEEADGVVENSLQGLEDMTGAQRSAARATLEAWRETYAAQGEAGKAAVVQIDAALKRLTSSGDAARRKAGDLVVLDPQAATTDFGRKLGSIGKADDAESARASAEQQFQELLNTYRSGIADVEAALAQFADKRDQDLTPDERKTRDGLRATLALYQGFVTQTTAAATAAGEKAAAAFTQAQQDQAAESALALVEAQHELAQAEGRDDSPAYLAGLNAALAYWRARLKGLVEGTPAYLNALKKITELEGKAAQAREGEKLPTSLSKAASIIGKGGKLQATLSAGLDGLAAYFDKGGKQGGTKAILAGAEAFVGGLADIFKTGDEDVDRVLDTFVGGVQATLGQLASGNWMGAIITGLATVVSTIIDIFTGGRNSLRKAQQEIKSATEGIRFFDLSKYARVESRGGFLGFLGFKKSVIDQEALDIARSLGDAIYNAISTALLDGIRSGKASFTDLGLDIRKSLGEQILQGLIDGFLKGAVMQGILQPFLDAYIQAMKTGNAQALADAANGIQAAIGQSNAAIAQFYQDVLVPTSQQLGLFGTDGANSNLGGNAVTDLGLASAPAAVMAAPAYVLDHTTAMTRHTAALEKVAPLLERWADEGIAVDARAQVVVQAPRSDLRAYATR